MTDVKTRLVVYDLDGTLVDSAGHIANVVNKTRRHYGLSPLSVDEVRPCIGDGAQTLVEKSLFGLAGAPPPSFGVLSRAAHPLPGVFSTFMDIYSADTSSGIGVVDGVMETLERLGKLGIAQAVLTNKPHAAALEVIEAMGLSPFIFMTIGPGARVPGVSGPMPAKPDPTGLRHLMLLAGASPEETIMVGDGIQDVRVAAAAGARCIAIASEDFLVPMFVATGLSRSRVVGSFADAAALID